MGSNQIPTAVHTQDDRAQFTAALRELADFIDAHPDLPLPYSAQVGPLLSGEDAWERGEVRRIAEVLETTPFCLGGDHYVVERQFGGDAPRNGIKYRAVAIPEERMAQHYAESSYTGSVTP